MKNLFSNQTPLIVIDVQKGFDDPVWGNRNNPQAEDNISSLLKQWRKTSKPVIHVHHCSLEKDSPLREGYSGNEVKEIAKPLQHEITFKKHVNSAFIGTQLESYLNENDFNTIVIVGLTTDHCVSTTTRMAGNLGFQVILISDASATFDRLGADGTHYSAGQIHDIHLASLNEEFCEVYTTQAVLEKINS